MSIVRFKNNIIFFIIIINFMGIATAKDFTYDSQGKRDPFFRVNDKKEEESLENTAEVLTPKEKLEKLGVKPSSIIYDEINPAILIGDEILEVGNTIKGVIIRAIERDYVIFEVEGETVEYNLNNLDDQ